MTSPLPYGLVAIGRNEGERLKQCLFSASHAELIVYVDSGSSDGSAAWARTNGFEVVELDMGRGFTAARARNAGFKRLVQMAPHLQYVQFVDGDCELAQEWPHMAVSFLEQRSDAAAVCGRLRERYPERSVYNWLCDREWDRPAGEIKSCAGNVMMRIRSLEHVGGYREDVIAAEEDELCVRLRQAGWKIWRLSVPMALHDAAMLHFGQWWRRARRSGYAFAQGHHLHGGPPERHFAREVRRAVIWGLLLPLAIVVITAALTWFGLLALLVYPLQFVRLAAINRGSPLSRARMALFQILSRFPEGLGVAMFWRDQLLHRPPRLIEHKQVVKTTNP